MKTNRVLFLLLLLIFTMPMVGFSQKINIQPVSWEKGEEVFLSGCLPGKGGYKLLNPSIYAVLDSGIVNLNPEKDEIHVIAQNDGTPQAAKYQPSQLAGINYRARVLRSKTIASYLRSKGFKVVVEKTPMSVPEKGALYRGAWIRVEDRFDVQSRIQALEASNREMSKKLDNLGDNMAHDFSSLQSQIDVLNKRVADLEKYPLGFQNQWQAYGFISKHSHAGVGVMVKFPSGWMLNGEYSYVNWNIYYEQAWNVKLGRQLKFVPEKFGEFYITTGVGRGEQLDGNWTASWGSLGLLYDFHLTQGIHFLAGVDGQYKFKHQKAKVGPLEFYETETGFSYTQKILRPEIKENKFDGWVFMGIGIEFNLRKGK